MKKVIEYLMEINWDYLPTNEVIEKLRDKFEIRNLEGQEATEELLLTVIYWEKHSEIYDSLEKILKEKFVLM
jgi:hypothetical protein